MNLGSNWVVGEEFIKVSHGDYTSLVRVPAFVIYTNASKLFVAAGKAFPFEQERSAF